MSSSSNTNARSFFILFFILTVAFSLTFAGIVKSNTTIGIDAYAAKSKGSSGGSSSGGGGGSGSSGGGSSGGGGSDKSGSTKKSTVSKGRSSPTTNEEEEEKQETPQEQLQEQQQPQLEQQEQVHQQEEKQETPQEQLQEQQQPQLEQQEQTQLQQQEQQQQQQQSVPGVIPGINPNPNTNPNPPTTMPSPPTGGSTLTPPSGTEQPNPTPPTPPSGTEQPNPTPPTPPPIGTPPPSTEEPTITPPPTEGTPLIAPTPTPTGEPTPTPPTPTILTPICPHPIGSKGPDCYIPPPICPKGTKLVNGRCVPIIIPPCPKGFHHDRNGRCIPDCPPGFHLDKGVCTKNIVINVIKKTTTTEVHNTQIEITVRNFILTNFQGLMKGQQMPTFLLLIDTAQVCGIAGDTACVDTQNQFKTFNLVTKLDTTGKTWIINGQVQNVARPAGKTLSNVQVTARFYDINGNNVGGLQQVPVSPATLKSLQSGVFNIRAPTSVMSGTPSFVRLEYVTTR